MTINLTGIASSPASLVSSLSFSTNCTVSMNWYDVHNPIKYWNDTSGIFDFGLYENSSLNAEFLVASLAREYQKNSAVIEVVQIEMARLWEIEGVEDPSSTFAEGLQSFKTTWNGGIPPNTLNNGTSLHLKIEWYQKALWQIYTDCVSQELYPLRLADLNTGSDCETSAGFIVEMQPDIANSHDPLKMSYSYPLYTKTELEFWKSFLQPLNPRLNELANFLSDTSHRRMNEHFHFANGAVVSYLENLFRGPESGNVTQFLRQVYDICQKDICGVSGFTGNPDIGGIGVLVAYMLESVLVTLIWIIYSSSIIFKSTGIPKALHKALEHVHETLLDAAMYFLLGLAFANVFQFITLSVNENLSSYELSIGTLVANIALFNLLLLTWVSWESIFIKKRQQILFCLWGSWVLSVLPTTFIIQITNGYGPNSASNDRTCLAAALKSPSLEIYGWFSGAAWSTLPWIAASLSSDSRFQSSEQIGVQYWKLFAPSVIIALLWIDIYLLVHLRDAMQTIAGDTWSEAKWGFGQAVALLTWIPASFAIYSLLADCYTLYSRKRRSLNGNMDIQLFSTPVKV